jgi:uncharacterized protein YyaL (SSP411 family)
MNRLAAATSPYLLQHKDNPVDWWEWSGEAFEEARRRDVPVLLSIGYSACHWCHVMAHESFEDSATAAAMNEHFVNIKVDREERPDVDAVYMEATQAMTGHGGWPMTCLLTPDGEPFFAGTYFPDTPRHGNPSFRQVLTAITQAWRDRRADVTKVGADVVVHLRASRSLTGAQPPDAGALDRAKVTLSNEFDAVRGGFGSAPKFPPSMVLQFLLRHHARTGDQQALTMLGATCEAMARGGLNDQLAGGFARYSVDAGWVVPHFEKMLYDNALLLRVYLHWHRQTGSALGRRVAVETADFLLDELRTDEGGFASALDADSEGVEGKFYVWTSAELVDALGPDDGTWAAEILEVTEQGSFEAGASTLQLLTDPEDQSRLARLRERLAAVRASRVRPGRDDKVVTSWNGLAIAALAEAGGELGEPRFLDAARMAAELVRDLHRDPEGRLLRTSLAGRAGRPLGVLEDHADLAEGYLALHCVTGDAEWLRGAGDLLDQVLSRFGDGRGGFFDTAVDAERLVSRPQDPTDNATPSGQSAAAGALLSYAALTGSATHRTAAETALASTARLAEQAPRYAGWWLATAEALQAGPVEVAVVGEPEDPLRAALHRTALSSPAPGAVVSIGVPDAAGVPLLADRPLLDGKAAAYVCRGFVCRRPVSSPDELAQLMLASP